MNIVIAVAQYKNHEQLRGFLAEISRCKLVKYRRTALIVVDTDGTTHKRTEEAGGVPVSRISVPDRPRKYASVMYEKVRVAARYCDDETIAFMSDPDYSMNPYALQFAHLIMAEHPEVDYLCLLKEPGLADKKLQRINLSGFNFVKYPSMMGGAMIVRWASFYPMVQRFFEEYGVTGEDSGRAGGFDQEYWRWLKKQTGDDRPVVMASSIGLMQHCNTVSNFIESKGPEGVWSHMHSLDYDPRCNPFELIRLSK